MMSGSLLQFVKAIYNYNAQDQGDLGLPFVESSVIYVAERLDDGWCRGFTLGKEGWFPASYAKAIVAEPALDAVRLSQVLRSPQWAAYATPEDKIYFVNQSNQSTTWELPQLVNEARARSRTTSPQSPVSPVVNTVKVGSATSATPPAVKRQSSGHGQKAATLPSSKPRLVTINGLTFADGGPKQPLIEPNQPSFVDYFWSDKLEKSGFDILLAKHINGKMVLKDVIEFMKERAAIEDAYAKSLLKLSKSMLGSQEEGTLLQAWHSVKTELVARANIHSSFSDQLLTDFNKELFEYKEGQKKDRKQHELIIAQDRKQLLQLDATIEKGKQALATKQKEIETKKLARKTSLKDIEVARRRSSYASEELKRTEELYNDAQKKWVIDMISACKDFEHHEQERSKFIQDMLYKYVDMHAGTHEKSAESLSKVTDAVDKVNTKADREAFIRQRNTGTQRPVDRR